jgi:hypothetical protein
MELAEEEEETNPAQLSLESLSSSFLQYPLHYYHLYLLFGVKGYPKSSSERSLLLLLSLTLVYS